MSEAQNQNGGGVATAEPVVDSTQDTGKGKTGGAKDAKGDAPPPKAGAKDAKAADDKSQPDMTEEQRALFMKGQAAMLPEIEKHAAMIEQLKADSAKIVGETQSQWEKKYADLEKAQLNKLNELAGQIAERDLAISRNKTKLDHYQVLLDQEKKREDGERATLTERLEKLPKALQGAISKSLPIEDLRRAIEAQESVVSHIGAARFGNDAASQTRQNGLGPFKEDEVIEAVRKRDGQRMGVAPLVELAQTYGRTMQEVLAAEAYLRAQGKIG
jgi:DNA-binding transcriptional ArsR family regulator